MVRSLTNRVDSTSTGKQRQAQKPATKKSKRARPSKVKGAPRHPERLKLKKDGSPSRSGEGGGRPRKWAQADKLEFFEQGRLWIQRRRKKGQPCSIVAFCDRENVWVERLSEWARESEELAEAYGRMKQAAEAGLLEFGAYSRNFVFGIFQLNSDHGYSSKEQRDDEPEAAPYEPTVAQG